MGTWQNSQGLLADVDLRLLRVFQAVVRHQGFARAQFELDLSPATISNHIAHLESRLGLRLCTRGRGGFALTEEGARIHEASLNLFRSAENFSSIASSVRGELAGTVHFSTVDAMYTNPTLKLAQALGEFAKSAPKVLLHIEVASPQDLRQRLLEGRYQLILTPIEDAHPSIVSTPMFKEKQVLVCGSAHPLFSVPDRTISRETLAQQAFAARSYMQGQRPPRGLKFNPSAVTSHMESLALLILSGTYIGYLPEHFCASWIAAGAMRNLQDSMASYSDEFYLAHLAREQNRSVKLLSDLIVSGCSDKSSVSS